MINVIIVGVGEVTEAVPENLEQASSPLDLMEKACIAACQDTGRDDIKKAIDTLAVIRTFSDTTATLKSKFGDPVNVPRSVAKRLGASPENAVYSKSGGQSPQDFVNEFSTKIVNGECEAVLIVGAEALANQKALMRAKVKADWSDNTDGPVDDRGADMSATLDAEQLNNQLLSIPPIYSLFENNRRKRLGLSREDYARECAALFAPFSDVACHHDYAMFPQNYSAQDIVSVTDENTRITDCYTRAMVAKDGVNQAAALVMMSEDKARELGIDPSLWVYPVAGSSASELPINKREDLGGSIAMTAAYDAAFEAADMAVDDITHMDIYSCFPVAVFAACEALAIQPDDPRGLTVTGGLPFFGGAGNNYASHGIVNIVKSLRKTKAGIGLVGANGGFLSKHSIGIYAAQPPAKGWREADKAAIVKRVKAQNSPEIAPYADGRAHIESYSVEFNRKGAKQAFIVGRLPDNRRFYGQTAAGDSETIQSLLEADPLQRPVFVTSKGPGNRFTFEASKTRALIPAVPKNLDGEYAFCKVARHGHILEVTLNRPEARNSLTPEANFELEDIFNLFEADRSLWVAILTGAGDKAFSAGNDLKYTASGKQMWVPETGFAGLTHRKNRTKPVIAAVNGFAYGGGLEIALACDIIVADETAKFALPEVKVGLIAAAGGVFRLPKAIPPHIAKDMILTGRAMDVDEAAAHGLVNYKAAQGDVMTKAREIAEQLCTVSPTAVSASLAMINAGEAYADPLEALEQSSSIILNVVTSEDLQIGIMAFLTKQKAIWKNK